MMSTVSRLHKRIKISWVLAIALAICFAGLIAQQNASANHPVLVEGERDFDGDGLLGTAEDTDNATDRVFGTIGAALLMPNGAANANGFATIVTSGRFPEAVRIPNTDGGQATLNGVTVLEAAPGVGAIIDAVLAGNPNNATRQAAPGIIIATDQTDRSVVLRNLTIRNFTEGIQVNGTARVQIVNCRLDSNLNFGIRATGTSRVMIADTTVNASGQRFNPMVGTPGPGTGIRFEDQASGAIIRSTVAGNTAAGISNATTPVRTVLLLGNTLFDNGANFAAGASTNLKTAFTTITDETQLEVGDQLNQ